MAKQNRTYTAIINTEEDQDVVMVDMHDLPYDRFDAEHPLVILDDVDLGKSKNRTWPDFSNVIVKGAFDCSDFQITSKTVLPRTFKKLICKFSISDLGVLFGLLPLGVESIVVRPALLNNIKKNKDGALDTARAFAKSYPGITVTDGKQTLKEVFAELYMATSAAAEKKIKVKTVTEPVYADKTAEWLDSNELIDYCMRTSDKVAQLPFESVERYVRIARSAKAGLNIRTERLKRGADIVSCVHVDSAPAVLEYVESSIAAKFAKETKVEKEAPKKSKEPVVAVPAQPRFFVGSDEIKPVRIKKYISKSAWTQIRSKCSCSVPEQLRILNDIQCINVDPASTKGNSVVYIQNGSVKKSRTVKFKSVRCLSQGFGSVDNNSRLVWGVSGNTFVCQKFFANHSTGDEYQWYMRDLYVDLAQLDLSEFLYVPDLIQELSGDRGPAPSDTPDKESAKKVDDTNSAEDIVVDSASDVVPEQTGSALKPVAVPEPTNMAPEITGASKDKEEGATNSVTSKPAVKASPRKRIKKRKSEFVVRVIPCAGIGDCVLGTDSGKADNAVNKNEQFNKGQKHARSGTEKHTANMANMPKPEDWVDLYSLNYKVVETTKKLAQRQSALLIHMLAEHNTENMLRLTQELESVLQEKKKCEHALLLLKNTNAQLKELQQLFKKR